MTEDGGVLGNLPRSRPGHRSAKRSDPRSGASGAKPAAGSRRTAGAARGERHALPREQPAQTTGPVGSALRLAGSVPAGGARVAHELAREVLRRLPRP